MAGEMGGDGTEKALVLFIHGLGGDGQATWGLFPEFLRQDRDIDTRYELAFFSYPTTLWRHLFSPRSPRIQELTAGLRTEITNRYADFRRIVLCVTASVGWWRDNTFWKRRKPSVPSAR
jgi:hypothetical protein